MFAVDMAGIVLVRSDPRDVVGAIELSRATYRKMIQNLFGPRRTIWSQFRSLPDCFSAGDSELPMSVGAIAMSLSTIIVARRSTLRGLNWDESPWSQ